MSISGTSMSKLMANLTSHHRFQRIACPCPHLPEHSERPFSTLETRSRTSSFQSHASRRDREFLPFSLMLRDEIENFCLSVSCFETRMRIWSYNLMFRDESEIFSHQSRASRREREFLLSVSFFETRISVLTLVLWDENENNVEGWLPLFLAQSIIKKNSDEWIL